MLQSTESPPRHATRAGIETSPVGAVAERIPTPESGYTLWDSLGFSAMLRFGKPALPKRRSAEARFQMQNSSENRGGRNARSRSTGMVRETGGVPRPPVETPKSGAATVDPTPRIQPVSERFPALERQEITLTLSAPEAKEVNVAGDFNGWRPEATPLNNPNGGEWAVRLMLRSGQYQYRFVVDGQWSEDPQASGRVANPHGGFNSILEVPLEVRTSIL